MRAAPPPSDGGRRLPAATHRATINNTNKSEDGPDGVYAFVCSWPKSGTTWMQAIVAHLVAPDRSSWKHVSEVTPFYDVEASWGRPAPVASAHATF